MQVNLREADIYVEELSQVAKESTVHRRGGGPKEERLGAQHVREGPGGGI